VCGSVMSVALFVLNEPSRLGASDKGFRARQPLWQRAIPLLITAIVIGGATTANGPSSGCSG
jgi:hypothetical protein